MAKARGIRRFLRFSLRSVLLLTLGVALWLGYEVRQARLNEGHRRAIEALGGQVETEPRGLSLLRFVVGGDFGQQVVAAEISGQTVGDATNALVSMPYLRRVRVVYDGTCDLHPAWDRLNERLPGKIIEPTRDSEYPYFFGANSPSAERLLRRLLEKMEQGTAKAQQLLRDLQHGVRPSETWYMRYETISYRVRQLTDGTVVELLLGNGLGLDVPGSDSAFTIMLVDDRAIDGAMFDVSTRQGTQDVDLIDVSDGGLAVGFQYHRAGAMWRIDKRARQIPGDSRYWLGLYRIERDGFVSLLPEAKASP